MDHAQPKLDFIPPTFNPFVLRMVHLSLPMLQRFRVQPWLPAGISPIETVNGETLVDLYHQFQNNKIRLILAFRHCEVDDPLSGLYLFSRAIPKLARQQGISLQSPIHSHFMYDRGMTIWAGNWLGWLFAQIGGIPVHRGKTLDWQAIKKARELLVNGRFPLTVAPEGATNGHSEVVSPLEPGVAQLAFWCVEDLAKAKRVEQVVVVPINIQYRYINPQWSKLDWLLSKLEADCGLAKSIEVASTEKPEQFYYQRLLRLGEYLLTEMEHFYRHFYHRHFPDLPQSLSREENLTVRLQNLLDLSLQVGEEYFGLKQKGNIIERCRRLEEAGWNYIYREELSNLKSLSSLKRGLADLIAAEASLRMLHMRLVESFVAVTGTYIQEKPCFERFAETSLILFDAIARIKGTRNPRRPRLGWRKSRVTIGEPISVNQRAIAYQQNRQGAKQAVAQLTHDLQIALEKMIV
ncbi:phospholipid/glycerol acyltransferase [Stanieria cyanosphaera PCC 7437]|uniref:Phospholipid/glycerol acyltransferase n=1 Tax=Stanieria cyanosphaera (strain ATCC 29371 / PCC 7437) TaxID=111780 RepID=K9XWT8_STAC7|nr:1-acyl-sn-glycerol-3-phosphate acyltransferase [Stanieria cyanosphaera]AFZ37003.1 phospholipid/glycerol acyltransferase [Stanieria cyanosphaera PCC 7437]